MVERTQTTSATTPNKNNMSSCQDGRPTFAFVVSGAVVGVDINGGRGVVRAPPGVVEGCGIV